MWRVVFVLCVVCCSRAFATTLTVDGVGTSPEHFATIREALIDLGASGLGTDGASDEIAVTVNRLTEPGGLIVNGDPASFEGFMPVSDDLAVEGDADGDGAPCRLTLAALPLSVYLEVRVGEGQSLTLRDLDLLPGSWNGQGLHGMVDISDAGNAHLRLENVYVGPAGGLPVNYSVLDPTAVRLFHRGSDEPITVDMVGCDIVNHLASGLRFDFGSGTVTIRDTRVTGCRYFDPFLGWLGAGISLASRLDASAELDHVVCDDNGVGFLSGGASTPGSLLSVALGPGCSLSRNRSSATSISSQSAITAVGTSPEPIRVCCNADTGLGLRLPPNGGLTAESVVATGNGGAGLSMLAQPDQRGTVLVRHCLVAGNGVDPPQLSIYGNVHISRPYGPAFASASVEFEACTFDDFITAGPEPGDVPELWADFAAFEITLRDCILSGTSDETALDVYHPLPDPLKRWVLENSLIALEGPDALGSINAQGGGTVELIDCLFVDPMYVQTTDPDAPGYYDVQNPLLEHAGSDGGPLSGWGDYVGPPAGPSHGILVY